jgi:hypothetical protein
MVLWSLIILSFIYYVMCYGFDYKDYGFQNPTIAIILTGMVNSYFFIFKRHLFYFFFPLSLWTFIIYYHISVP